MVILPKFSTMPFFSRDWQTYTQINMEMQKNQNNLEKKEQSCRSSQVSNLLQSCSFPFLCYLLSIICIVKFNNPSSFLILPDFTATFNNFDPPWLLIEAFLLCTSIMPHSLVFNCIRGDSSILLQTHLLTYLYLSKYLRGKSQS